MRGVDPRFEMKLIGAGSSKKIIQEMIAKYGDKTLQELFTIANPGYDWAVGIIGVFGAESLASEVVDGFEEIMAFRAACASEENP